MLPRWHIFFGAIFTLVVFVMIPSLSWFYLTLIFLSSFLIDFDHYLVSAFRRGKVISLSDSLKYHDELGIKERAEINKGIKRKGDFHIFHTIEFHALIGLLGFFWVGFFYIFIGMFFHSLLDVYTGLRDGWLHKREFFFFNWIGKKI